MDSSITAAGRALRAGDPLAALKQVALRDDPAALALRGIAMAQLGDLPKARELLRPAAADPAAPAPREGRRGGRSAGEAEAGGGAGAAGGGRGVGVVRDRPAAGAGGACG